jgi:hypothetical protein
LNIFLQEKAVEATKQKEEKRKKPKPEEQEGMPRKKTFKEYFAVRTGGNAGYMSVF